MPTSSRKVVSYTHLEGVGETMATMVDQIDLDVSDLFHMLLINVGENIFGDTPTVVPLGT